MGFPQSSKQAASRLQGDLQHLMLIAWIDIGQFAESVVCSLYLAIVT